MAAAGSDTGTTASVTRETTRPPHTRCCCCCPQRTCLDFVAEDDRAWRAALLQHPQQPRRLAHKPRLLVHLVAPAAVHQLLDDACGGGEARQGEARQVGRQVPRQGVGGGGLSRWRCVRLVQGGATAPLHDFCSGAAGAEGGGGLTWCSAVEAGPQGRHQAGVLLQHVHVCVCGGDRTQRQSGKSDACPASCDISALVEPPPCHTAAAGSDTSPACPPASGGHSSGLCSSGGSHPAATATHLLKIEVHLLRDGGGGKHKACGRRRSLAQRPHLVGKRKVLACVGGGSVGRQQRVGARLGLAPS